jgi:solute carrier family 35 protein E1
MAIKIPAEALRVFLLCIVWYSISSTNSVIGKKLLNEFPHPTTVAFVQVLCTALFLGPTLLIWRVPKNMPIPRAALFKLIIPLSFGKALAAVSAYFSIWRIPVSYAHTSKL